MMKDISLGQYYPADSFLHRLDPRIKLLSTVVFLVAAFSAKSHWCFVLLTAATLLFVALSRIPIRTILRGVKPLIFVLLFTAVLLLFTTKGEGEPYFSLSVFSLFSLEIYPMGVSYAFLFSLRIVLVVIVTGLFLTYTTTPTKLTDALESVFHPLTYIGIPVYDFAMMMTIALRFIPTLTEETDKILSAQKARGADFSSGSLLKKAKALLPILIPLFASSFRRAGELGVAMECRCYRGGAGRTRLHRFRLRFSDILFLLLCGVGTALIYLGNAYLPTPYML